MGEVLLLSDGEESDLLFCWFKVPVSFLHFFLLSVQELLDVLLTFSLCSPDIFCCDCDDEVDPLSLSSPFFPFRGGEATIVERIIEARNHSYINVTVLINGEMK